MRYEDLVNNEDYSFLFNDVHLKDSILFLCLGGSFSYGTNVETSDIDIRGVCLPSLSDVIGVTNFEQYVDNKTDTVIYSLPKFINLVSSCNPNVIEMLFCKEEHYLYVSPLGKKLLENRHLFLSKRAFYTFGGYANAQLNRLENAIARDGNILNNHQMCEHINRSIENCVSSFIKYDIKEDDIKTYVGCYKEGLDEEILCDFNLKGYPLSKLKSVVEEMSNVLRTYKDTVGQRNKKKDDVHLNKHMMHLIRLYLMRYEILSTNDLHTYREFDHELLMNIRNGFYRDDDGKVKNEFYEMLHELEDKCKIAYKNSTLNNNVDKTKIYNLLEEIYKESIFK